MTSALWHAVFGNDRPVEIEIGPGRGDVLLAFATADPTTNYFGIEIRRGSADALTARIADAGLTNCRVVGGDARCIVEHLVPRQSVRAYHAYFPDPWPKTRHRGRRLFQPGLAAALARSLESQGTVHVASDLRWVFDAMCTELDSSGFEAVGGRPVRPRPVTKFERKYAGAGTHARSYCWPQAADAGSPSPQKTS